METTLRRTPNLLLQALQPEDRARLEPHLIRTAFDRSEYLSRAGERIEHLHFIESGVVSTVSAQPYGPRIEVVVIGREGMTGVSALLMAERSPYDTMVQIDHASALRIEVDRLHDAMDASRSLRATLLRYTQTLLAQGTNNAVANIASRLDARLARWLLMCHDRIDGDEVELTHDYMAMMIGAQRSAVTATLHILEGENLVRTRRGSVTIVDRAGLEAAAGPAYGLAETEYRRLIGPFGKSPEAALRVYEDSTV